MSNIKIHDRVRMVFMPDDPDPIRPGTMGTVVSVNHFTRGISTNRPETQLGVRWDNGRTLSVITPPDIVDVIDGDGPADQAS